MAPEKYWSNFADDFEEHNTYVVGNTDMQVIFDEVKKLEGLNRVLELGCGNGTYAKLLSENATSITATDYSAEMVAVAAKKTKSYSKTQVEKAHCFKLPYPDTSFNALFVANILHVIPTPQ